MVGTGRGWWLVVQIIINCDLEFFTFRKAGLSYGRTECKLSGIFYCDIITIRKSPQKPAFDLFLL